MTFHKTLIIDPMFWADDTPTHPLPSALERWANLALIATAQYKPDKGRDVARWATGALEQVPKAVQQLIAVEKSGTMEDIYAYFRNAITGKPKKDEGTAKETS